MNRKKQAKQQAKHEVIGQTFRGGDLLYDKVSKWNVGQANDGVDIDWQASGEATTLRVPRRALVMAGRMLRNAYEVRLFYFPNTEPIDPKHVESSSVFGKGKNWGHDFIKPELPVLCICYRLEGVEGRMRLPHLKDLNQTNLTLTVVGG